MKRISSDILIGLTCAVLLLGASPVSAQTEPNGSPCSTDGECISNHCANGFCCAGGDCCDTAASCPASYSSDSSCAAPSSCQGVREDATCIDSQCGSQLVNDDSGCDEATEASTCGPYPSAFCDGTSDQAIPFCATSCANDNDCDETAHCDASSCVADLGEGASCDENSDCSSDNCSDGVCGAPVPVELQGFSVH